MSYLANIIGSAIMLQISSTDKKSFKAATKQWEKVLKFFEQAGDYSRAITEEDEREIKSKKASKVLNQLLSIVPAVKGKK